WSIIEDDYNYLQNLAKTLFAIVPSQANSCIYSFYISNLKKVLVYYGKDLSEIELHNNALNQTSFTNNENNDMIIAESEEKFLEISSIVDLSDAIFGGQGYVEESLATIRESGNIEFDPIMIVQNELQSIDPNLL
ncbi:11652_t:CDS:2, partial [Racocetra fulgida]